MNCRAHSISTGCINRPGSEVVAVIVVDVLNIRRVWAGNVQRYRVKLVCAGSVTRSPVNEHRASQH
jgi:hypothetical protein